MKRAFSKNTNKYEGLLCEFHPTLKINYRRMKNVMNLTLLAVAVFIQISAQAQNTSAMYRCNIDCESCVDKIMKNIPYEKGVKMVNVELDQQLVTVEFKTGKNTTAEIEKALEKLGYASDYLGEPTTFWVNGNCDMCKEKIESAAKAVPGVNAAVWSPEKKQAAIAYDASKTNLDEIQKAIAGVGYDTKKYKADDATYNALHSCCKYER